MQVIIAGVILLLLLFVAVRPKWGASLVWLILFTYPHGWWYYQGFLPLNIGFDDLFCIYLFIIVFFRRNLFEGVPIRFGYAFWVLFGFTMVAIIADCSGFMQSAQLTAKTDLIKGVLKNAQVFAMFYAILHCIDDEQDLAKHLAMLSVAGVIGALLVILQRYFPYQLEIFALPKTFEQGLTYEARGAGAFMNANGAANVLGCLALLLIPAIRIQKNTIMKILLWLSAGILILGLIHTQSRSGFLMFGVTLLFIVFISQDRSIGVSILIMGVIVGLVFLGYSQLVIERFREAYNPASGEWGGNVLGRVRTWVGYFETATVQDYIFGQGPIQGIAKNGMEPHSAYVALVTVYGLGGVIWAFLSVYYFFRKAIPLVRSFYPMLAAVGRGCIWLLIAWGIFSNTSNTLSPGYARLMLFLCVLLLDRASYFAVQHQSMGYWVGTDEMFMIPDADVGSFSM
ncbi:MAG: hypothetical protein JXA82_01480 [Sedimentisphaerales bacterium]|nr:hypothetical protein [Sedimentisphaerales bacterium]